jgi:hypothetical protein
MSDTAKFIFFDPDNLADCERAIMEMEIILRRRHGSAAVTRLFSTAVSSKRHLQKEANIYLMVAYMRSKLSAKRFAKALAEKNKSLPRERRYGGGSINPETLERQIRREKKRMQTDELYRDLVDRMIAWQAPEWTFRNKMSEDILK